MLLKIIARSSRPSERAFRCVSSPSFCRRRFDALIENHDDIRAKRDLDLERFLGRQKMFGAVEMRAERHTFVRHLAQFAQAENLIAARIGENRSRPGHELVQPAHRANQFMPGAKIQVISIRKENLHAEILEVLLRLPFHRGGRPHGHERRRIDHSMRSGQPAESRAGRIRGQNFKRKIHSRKCIRNAGYRCRKAKASGQFWPNRARTGPELRRCVAGYSDLRREFTSCAFTSCAPRPTCA